MIRIEVLDAEAARRHVSGLGAVLADCVRNGASVSFMNPFPQDEAEGFFRAIADKVATGEVILVAAFDGTRIVGTAQLGLDMPPNQPHRGDIRKMLVHSDARRQGVAGAMLARLEQEAAARGRTLLVLDTASAEAMRVYERGGWAQVGRIPDYALLPDGGFCDTIFYMKRLQAFRS